MAAQGQHRASLRKILESALASRRGAAELMDAIVELQVTMNALLAKLDADSTDTGGDNDYEATLAVTPLE